jgi:isoquinoline 1-oxidoreductase beta subunit
MYRPYYYDRIQAGLDEDGMPIAWSHRVTGSSIVARFAPAWLEEGGLDGDAVEGAADPPYAFPNFLVDYVRQEPAGIRTAFWRGVGPTHNVFVVESFLDELAAAAKQDPVAYRRALLAHSPRALAVLELAAAQAGWGRRLPEGRGLGIAVLHAFGTYMAQVAEVSVAADGAVRVHRVVAAVDCGVAVNPDTVRAQTESGVLYGLGAALWGEITLRNGRVEQSNFHDHRVLRIHESPAIDVHLVESGEAPGGIGEPGTSCIFPAVTNAVFAATGKRIRKLPIDPAALAAEAAAARAPS